MKGHIVNLPNILSLSRIVLIPFFIYYYDRGDIWTALGVLVVAVLTDWFDGRTARWTHEVSDMGKILDPFADKVCLATVAVYFMYIGELPVWFVVFVVLRDLLIFLGAAYVKYRHQVITTSLWPGKWAVGFVSMMFLAMIWPHPVFDRYPLQEFFMYLSVLMLFVSFVQYSLRFYRIVKGLEYRA
ncbi:CDP-alcohol phosphatidyltransferase family protein [Prosthecochloris sp. N3]|uniref:CDP-diacylglycerol--glycerol-3-phosphate 3-phosphatidyltransferase n=1 Tax=Prosthecochloris ethylica TaxID=2743976 RepID=A0ABR9XQ79_9CHLB|nr:MULTISPECIES: CDP-alcohol phosphatidyltransferase family protein [Prosthecochloris]MBF0586516.1 CDP-alcohol phosphatidyltransferase family protein [Prosthecochloris ethylica]MBF0636129.1 CDP-alcohol phosphatidyltransferase family protein [Prosthecochloris ethylica]NUK47734.1 CDP-alcohol phosphatidyltransferase family protein [Prosthecochloris ethylica]RNA65790.1 CDP-alcohol phosphatidyltransferase family protein [Prosthecochloris sp. ZM_2]